MSWSAMLTAYGLMGILFVIERFCEKVRSRLQRSHQALPLDEVPQDGNQSPSIEIK